MRIQGVKEIGHEDTLRVRHEVLWPNRDIDYVRLENDPQGRHYGYYVEGELVSVISVFVEGGIAQFRKFATLEAYRGKGLGSKLFAYMLKELETLLVQVIWCNARLDAMAFYKRFGFEATGSPFEKGGVLYKKMSKSMTNSL